MNLAFCTLNLLLWFGPRGFVADSPIQAFAVSPDGRRVACARDGNWFDIYDAATGSHVASGRASDGDQLRVLAFSPDGKTLAGGIHESSTVWLWDAATGEQHLSVNANPTGVRSLAFSPDGKLLACGGNYDGMARIVDPATRATRFEAAAGEGKDDRVRAVAFHPAGRLLVTSGTMLAPSRGVVSLFRMDDRPRFVRLLPDRGDFDKEAVAFHTTGRTAYIASGGAVRAVEVTTGGRRWEAWGDNDREVTRLAVSADGRMVAGGGDGGRVWVWDADTGERLSAFQAHTTRTIGMTAGGDRLFTAGEDRSVRVWPWPATRPPTVARPTAHDPMTLAGEDTAAAFATIRRLSDDPATADFVRYQLPPVRPLPADTARRVRSLVRQLAADDFDTRQAASRDLAALGPVVAPELRRALRAAADPEVTDRLEKLLQTVEPAEDSAEVVSARWLEVLERIGTPEAISLVRAVASGDPDHPRTEDASDTLARMTRGRKLGEENRR